MARNSFKKKVTQERIINFLKENPLASSSEINQSLHVEVFKHFKTIKEIYFLAGLTPIASHEKRTTKIRNRTIEYIQKNPNATQWEVNTFCRTKVQEQFPGGIQGAYEKAGIPYPAERKKLYGTARKEIKQRARNFERMVVHYLQQRGRVFPQYKTDTGRLDALFIEIGTIYAVEIKDYHTKPITRKEIEQLNRYIDSVPSCSSGLLITHRNTKRAKNKIYIGKNKISIVDKEDLTLLPLSRGDVV